MEEVGSTVFSAHLFAGPKTSPVEAIQSRQKEPYSNPPQKFPKSHPFIKIVICFYYDDIFNKFSGKEKQNHANKEDVRNRVTDKTFSCWFWILDIEGLSIINTKPTQLPHGYISFLL